MSIDFALPSIVAPRPIGKGIQSIDIVVFSIEFEAKSISKIGYRGMVDLKDLGCRKNQLILGQNQSTMTQSQLGML